MYYYTNELKIRVRSVRVKQIICETNSRLPFFSFSQNLKLHIFSVSLKNDSTIDTKHNKNT